MRGGAFLNGKEGRVGFRKKPSLLGKSDANECNENSFSNCRVQLALSTKRDGVILEERYCNEEQNKTPSYSAQLKDLRHQRNPRALNPPDRTGLRNLC